MRVAASCPLSSGLRARRPAPAGLELGSSAGPGQEERTVGVAFNQETATGNASTPRPADLELCHRRPCIRTCRRRAPRRILSGGKQMPPGLLPTSLPLLLVPLPSALWVSVAGSGASGTHASGSDLPSFHCIFVESLLWWQKEDKAWQPESSDCSLL